MKAEANVHPTQAVFFLNQAIREGKIQKGDLNRYTDDLTSEIKTLEERLNVLKGTVTFAGEVASTPLVQPSGEPKKAERKVSKSEKESRRLQGLYMRSLRAVPVRFRSKYKRLAKAEGRQAAIDAISKAYPRIVPRPFDAKPDGASDGSVLLSGVHTSNRAGRCTMQPATDRPRTGRDGTGRHD